MTSLASGKHDVTGWSDLDKDQFSTMQRLGIEERHWSPTLAHRSKQRKERKRLELRGIREHNAREIAAAQPESAAEADLLGAAATNSEVSQKVAAFLARERTISG